jgi:hypothetical protein
MQKYEGGALKASPDQPGHYVLIGPPTQRSKGKDMWFGAVRTGKSYVSYHLMSVTVCPCV